MKTKVTAKEVFELSSGRMRELLNAALTSQNERQYKFLIEHITVKSKNHLKEWLSGLSHCVGAISETRHKELLSVVLWNFDWLHEDKPTIEAYQDFMLHLASAQNSLVPHCISAVIKAFISCSTVDPKSSMQCTPLEVADQLHATLQRLLEVVPSSSFHLIDLLRVNFPLHTLRTTSGAVHNCYLENLLRIPQYYPSLQLPIIEMAVDRMITLDAGIIGISTTHQEEIQFFINDEQVQEAQERERLAGILDLLMTTMLQYLESQCADEDEMKIRLFDFFLAKLFHGKIMLTHRSKYVQFLLFYLSQFKAPHPRAFPEELLEYLANRFFDKSEHISVRQIALDYLSSYVCRAKFLPVTTTTELLGRLVQHLHLYLSTARDMVPNLEIHRLFYIMCQATFYIITYLSNSLISSAGCELLVQYQLERLIRSPLNPLKFCCSSITDAFASVMDRAGLLSFSCTELLQDRSKLIHRDTQNPLQSHFPFDPISYDLPTAAKFIQPHYNSCPDLWQDEEDEEDEGKARSVSSDIPDSAMSLDPSSFSRLSGGSFGSYSASPLLPSGDHHIAL